ncbi:Ubiquitin domain-containing UBFD1 isoform A [Micractinium conductrix]|uniref:Ubiquitin domain-containing UBFD1 isoform A n=1 Tax=Micractinium conductrix TaxID=554055 RepID=A0A2P6VIL3_9CHLO|nr:Ubiquitin domain-containing UBFD1 isoform A [Micractinium conductrix]|eukprot:PSC73943.1 Ubiquitin domain-containing UBFD1 isoform A [Micractinium conductrix]
MAELKDGSALGDTAEADKATGSSAYAQEAPAAAAAGASSTPPGSEAAAAAAAGSKRELEEGEQIAIKVVFGKQSTTTSRPALSTVADLKADIAQHTGVPPENQKLLFKGQLKDEQTLQDAGLKSGSKVIVMGSRPEEIKATALGKVGGGSGGDAFEDKPATEQWCEQEAHKKVLAKGRPDDGWPGIKERQVPLRDDQTYIPGLLNSQGTKVRLTFKPELQQLWVGSVKSTQKVPYHTVTKMESQLIKGQEEYSILRVKVGASAHSSLWLYYVPSQAVSGIKLRVLGVGALI